ncbi:MAG: 3'(2'),5'-bisphosphate nucleotidase CysQ [Bacteroides sp.]|nr:3'(2'),5'-bisphosphate nucleotidase CysQ [Bacteroides sp.]
MKSKSDLYSLVSVAMKAGRQASAAIMGIYVTPFDYEDKADGSPITLADRRSNDILTKALTATGIPVISEETRIEDYALRKPWEYFWLVDPLDGTKEFISRNGEFAINIGLMYRNRPIAGVILAPVKGEAWWGIVGDGAYKLENLNLAEEITVESLLSHSSILKPSPSKKSIAISVSRSHMEEQTQGLIEQIGKQMGQVKLIGKGSALKFGDLAEGWSDLYIRYSPTWEWDTAAGHAILLAQGGEVFHITRHTPFTYNKEMLNNPGFIAFARKEDSIRYFSDLTF